MKIRHVVGPSAINLMLDRLVLSYKRDGHIGDLTDPELEGLAQMVKKEQQTRASLSGKAGQEIAVDFGVWLESEHKTEQLPESGEKSA